MFTKCDAEHFPLENVQHQMHLMRTFCFALQKCIWCKNAFLRTFSFGKCSASHFPLENVMLNILQSQMFSIFVFCKAKNTAFFRFLTFWFAKMLCFLLCKKQRCCPYILLVLNIFFWKMFSIKCIFASNAFLQSKPKC